MTLELRVEQLTDQATGKTEKNLESIRRYFRKRLNFDGVHASENNIDSLSRAYCQLYGPNFNRDFVNVMINTFLIGYASGYARAKYIFID